MTTLEHVGSLYIENQRLLDEYRKLLALVGQIKTGDVKPESISIDAPKMSWAIALTANDLTQSPERVT